MLGKVGEWITQGIVAIFGSRNERVLKRMLPLVEEISSLEPEMERLPDAAFPEKTAEFRRRLDEGEEVDDLLPEAFALVREAGKRALGLRLYDVQLMGAIVLHRAGVAEMVTGEGKTLVAVAPAYLNALTGEGVHIVTVNDYLARRDRDWMGPIYEFLGMRAGVIQSEMLSAERKPQYQADVTYGTNNEFGFDYLRDNMKVAKRDQCQKELHYAIIDEADSILIDEARTPLIISGSAEEATDKYYVAHRVAKKLRGIQEADLEERARAQGLKKEDIETDWDYWYSEKHHQVVLTEPGIERAEKLVGVDSFFTGANMDWPHHIEQALKAIKLYERDVEYVVKEGEVVIVDQFTGRLMPGRTWSDGLHQAIEAKEGLDIKKENQTLATVTIQNFFKLYDKLAGMTGTAMTEASEFSNIYEVDCVEVPTNRPLQRTEHPDSVYRTEREKYQAIADEIWAVWKTGRPQLVGTISIENSERLSGLLDRRGIDHEILNAKHHEREAHVVAEAGFLGHVTIATNMAGRGTDIVLGEFTREELLDHWRSANIAPRDARIDDDDLMDRLEEYWFEEGLIEEWEWRGILREFTDEDGVKRKGLPLCTNVAELGGLHVIGTERHESRRIDNQLRGRTGRQGDPGSSRFFLSLEDDLMRIFAPDRVSWILEKLGMREGEEISHPWVTKSITRAQKKVESHNFEIRKRLLEYDEVMNDQRMLIYDSRQEVLDEGDVRGMVRNWLRDAVDAAVLRFANPEQYQSDRDYVGLALWVNKKAGLELEASALEEADDDGDLASFLLENVEEAYQEREEAVGEEEMRRIERFILLQKIDEKWKDHLHAMDQLRTAIGLRGYAQEDPKDSYKREGYELFEEMVESLKDEVTDLLFRVRVRSEDEEKLGEMWSPESFEHADATGAGFGKAKEPEAVGAGVGQMREKAMGPSDDAPVKTIKRKKAKVGRNDPCPCGSGQKYKKCCGP